MRGRYLTLLIMPVILAALYQSRTTLFRAWTSSSPFASRSAWAPTSSKMSTFQHPEYHIPISLPEGLSQSQLLSFRPFANWLATLQTSLAAQHSRPDHPFHRDPYALRSVTVQSYDLFGTGKGKGGGSAPRLGFVKLTSRVANGAGETLPGAVFLRGPSVAMLVLLVPDDAADVDAERRVLLTVQPRVAAGSLGFAELPAGMVDEGGTFAGQAAREMEEELGLVIGEHELVCLSDLAGGVGGAGEGVGGGGGGGAVGGEDHRLLPRAVYPSAGGCDEYIPIYMHERRVPREQLAQWSGKLTGLRDQGERITLKLVRMRDLWKEGAKDAKCLAAVALWEGLRREGKI